jgi:hypothetical protein
VARDLKEISNEMRYHERSGLGPTVFHVWAFGSKG